MFADISPRYDLLNHLLSLNVDRLWRRRIVAEIGLAKDDQVLDVCTGTADLAIEIARQLGPNGRVYGTDFTPEMLRLGQPKCKRAPGAALALAAADTLHLPFRDETFDAVTVAFGIRNVIDTDAALAELLRILKPGGKAGILEFSNSRVPGFRAAFSLYFHHVLPRVGALVARGKEGRRAYRYLPSSVAEFLPPEVLAKRMATAGFQSVKHHSLSLGIAAIHVATRPAAPSRKTTRAAAAPPLQ